MGIFVITNGIYEDEVIVGVATSEEDAESMIMKMRRALKTHSARYDRDFNWYGPLEPGQVQDRYGIKI